MIQGDTGTPSRHLEVQLYIFIDFRVNLRSLLGGLWRTFCVFSVIWGAKVADSFHVHLFDDVGVDILPECSGCMCLKHNKNCGFREIPLFQVFINLVSRGEVLGVILESVGGLGDTFSHLLGSWGEA